MRVGVVESIVEALPISTGGEHKVHSLLPSTCITMTSYLQPPTPVLKKKTFNRREKYIYIKNRAVGWGRFAKKEKKNSSVHAIYSTSNRAVGGVAPVIRPAYLSVCEAKAEDPLAEM